MIVSNPPVLDNVPPCMHRAMPAQAIAPVNGRYLLALARNWLSAAGYAASQPVISSSAASRP
jgi:hypothetical protein